MASGVSSSRIRFDSREKASSLDTSTNTTLTSPIIIPKLNVAEGFPLWLQRITEIGTESVENDSVTINYRANFLPGALIRIGCGPSDGM